MSILKLSKDIGKRIEISDGTVIQQHDKIHTLNTTAFEIFDLLDGSMSVQNVVDEINARYPECDVHQIVVDFIKQLYDAGLLIE